MIVFFCFTETIKVNHHERDHVYEHVFEGVPDKALEQVPFANIYFTTPSDFNSHLEDITRIYKGDVNNLVKVLNPEVVIKHDRFPKHIGFGDFEKELGQFKGKKELKIGIFNAMSNAIGDHLIGMRAFDYWQAKIREYLPNTKVHIALFQLNPLRLKTITKQWHPKFDEVYMMPNRYAKFMELDAFIDMGTLLARESFGTQPMIDFFYEAFSFKPETIPPENKRIKYAPKETNLQRIKIILDTIRSRGKPLLLFHYTSTSVVREMRPPQARKIIKGILDNSDYFVISADGLEYFHDRFIDLSFASVDIDSFASIIAQVDSVVTVDTSTYHLADAFDKPTVVLFTTIEPKLRIPYYPYTDSIMLENEGGMIYGEHHAPKEPEKLAKYIEYVDNKWEELDVSEILTKLRKMETKLTEQS